MGKYMMRFKIILLSNFNEVSEIISKQTLFYRQNNECSTFSSDVIYFTKNLL